MTRKKQIILSIAAAWLLLGMVLTLSGGKTEKASSYAAKMEAARLMQDWMEKIKEMKVQAGLELTEEDLHSTGLIGARYTFITTTLGDPAAKRTTCDPNMAALVVELLGQAGIRDALGNSIICRDLQPIGDLVLNLLEQIEPLTLYGSPPVGSLNRVVTEELGIPVITIETNRGEVLAERVQKQLAIVGFILNWYGLEAEAA